MKTWVCQQQLRRPDHSVISLSREEFTPDTVGADVTAKIAEGWTIGHQDSISITLRSPKFLFGNYKYRHYWREGWVD